MWLCTVYHESDTEGHKENFGMDVKHEPLRIKHPKHVRVPSEGRYDEAQEDDEDEQGHPPD